MFIFDANKEMIDVENMQLYRKKKIDVHVIFSTDLGKNGETIVLKTIEGDVQVEISDDNYVMIGLVNEVYPISRSYFDSKYEIIGTDDRYDVHLALKGENFKEGIVKKCRLYRDSFIYASKMDCDFKVITKNNYGAILNGCPGDYLACSNENHENVYIINGNLMNDSYEIYC